MGIGGIFFFFFFFGGNGEKSISPEPSVFIREDGGIGVQSCLPFCDPMDCSPPGSPVHGILQARILERVAMPLSRGSS